MAFHSFGFGASEPAPPGHLGKQEATTIGACNAELRAVNWDCRTIEVAFRFDFLGGEPVQFVDRLPLDWFRDHGDHVVRKIVEQFRDHMRSRVKGSDE